MSNALIDVDDCNKLHNFIFVLGNIDRYIINTNLHPFQKN